MAASADGGSELDLKGFQTFITDVVPNAIGGSVGELVDALEHVPEAVAGYVCVHSSVEWGLVMGCR